MVDFESNFRSALNKEDFDRVINLPNVKTFVTNLQKIGAINSVEEIVETHNNLFISTYFALNFLEDEKNIYKEQFKIAFNSLTVARIFHCSDIVRDMLVQTRNKIYPRRLPFPAIFIDTEIKFKDMTYFGILLIQGKSTDKAFTINLDENSKEYDEIMFFASGYKSDERGMSHYTFAVIDKEGNRETEYDKDQKFISLFICNFLDFLHDPNVTYVKASESSGASHKKLGIVT
jgi:hypothetical protein